MTEPLFQEIKFTDLFSEHVIKTDSEKVRKNSWNDFGLADNFVYIGGCYGYCPRDIILYGDKVAEKAKTQWLSLWGWINPQHETIAKEKFSAVALTRSRDGANVTAYGSWNDYPGHRFLALNVDVPPELAKFTRNY